MYNISQLLLIYKKTFSPQTLLLIYKSIRNTNPHFVQKEILPFLEGIEVNDFYVANAIFEVVEGLFWDGKFFDNEIFWIINRTGTFVPNLGNGKAYGENKFITNDSIAGQLYDKNIFTEKNGTELSANVFVEDFKDNQVNLNTCEDKIPENTNLSASDTNLKTNKEEKLSKLTLSKLLYPIIKYKPRDCINLILHLDSPDLILNLINLFKEIDHQIELYIFYCKKRKDFGVLNEIRNIIKIFLERKRIGEKRFVIGKMLSYFELFFIYFNMNSTSIILTDDDSCIKNNNCCIANDKSINKNNSCIKNNNCCIANDKSIKNNNACIANDKNINKNKSCIKNNKSIKNNNACIANDNCCIKNDKSIKNNNDFKRSISVANNNLCENISSIEFQCKNTCNNNENFNSCKNKKTDYNMNHKENTDATNMIDKNINENKNIDNIKYSNIDSVSTISKNIANTDNNKHEGMNNTSKHNFIFDFEMLDIFLSFLDEEKDKILVLENLHKISFLLEIDENMNFIDFNYEKYGENGFYDKANVEESYFDNNLNSEQHHGELTNDKLNFDNKCNSEQQCDGITNNELYFGNKNENKHSANNIYEQNSIKCENDNISVKNDNIFDENNNKNFDFQINNQIANNQINFLTENKNQKIKNAKNKILDSFLDSSKNVKNHFFTNKKFFKKIKPTEKILKKYLEWITERIFHFQVDTTNISNIFDDTTIFKNEVSLSQVGIFQKRLTETEIVEIFKIFRFFKKCDFEEVKILVRFFVAIDDSDFLSDGFGEIRREFLEIAIYFLERCVDCNFEKYCLISNGEVDLKFKENFKFCVDERKESELNNDLSAENDTDFLPLKNDKNLLFENDENMPMENDTDLLFENKKDRSLKIDTDLQLENNTDLLFENDKDRTLENDKDLQLEKNKNLKINESQIKEEINCITENNSNIKLKEKIDFNQNLPNQNAVNESNENIKNKNVKGLSEDFKNHIENLKNQNKNLNEKNDFYSINEIIQNLSNLSIRTEKNTANLYNNENIMTNENVTTNENIITNKNIITNEKIQKEEEAIKKEKEVIKKEEDLEISEENILTEENASNENQETENKNSKYTQGNNIFKENNEHIKILDEKIYKILLQLNLQENFESYILSFFNERRIFIKNLIDKKILKRLFILANKIENLHQLENLNKIDGINNLENYGKLNGINNLETYGKLNGINNLGDIKKNEHINDLGNIKKIEQITNLGDIKEIENINNLGNISAFTLTNQPEKGNENDNETEYNNKINKYINLEDYLQNSNLYSNNMKKEMRQNCFSSKEIIKNFYGLDFRSEKIVVDFLIEENMDDFLGEFAKSKYFYVREKVQEYFLNK